MIDYKFSENETLAELESYVDSTYSAHYSGRYQATDMIIDSGHGIGFTVGNIMKYAWRLGRKKGWNKDDIMKIMHYSMILIHILKKEGKIQ